MSNEVKLMSFMVLAAFLSFFLNSTLFAIDLGGVDTENPVDLYGPDGLAFTCDDILVPRGGYTNTAIFATAYGEQAGGASGETDPELLFTVALGSWDPTDDPDGNSVYMHVLFRSDDPPSGATPVWRPAPMVKSDGWDFDDIYNDDYFGVVREEDAAVIPEETLGGDGFRDSTWWEGGMNQRVSCASMSSWQKDSTNINDPAMSLTLDHFPPVREYVEDIRAKHLHFRVSCLTSLNMGTGDAGVAMFGDIQVGGLEVKIDASMAGVDITGTLKNDNPRVSVDTGVGDVDVEITGGSDEPPDSLLDGLGAVISGEIEIGACYILDMLRPNIEPELDPVALTQADKDRIYAQFTASPPTGIDCLANEVVRAVMHSGAWLPWLEAENAAVIINDTAPTSGDSIDLSGTALDTSSDGFATSKNYLDAAENTTGDSAHEVTNWGLDYISSEALIYGRDRVHRYSRFVEWYASNWLCMNLTDFQPYSCADQVHSSGQSDWEGLADWKYFDLICSKDMVDDDMELEAAWPPPSHWFGGQGIVLGVQGGVGHDGNSTPGKPTPAPSDNVSPGSPEHVFAGMITLSPFGHEQTPGSGSYVAPYNFRGITIGDGNCHELDFFPDSMAEDLRVLWPPVNDNPATELKFFHANVANGHDDSLTSGDYHAMWDFEGDGVPNLTFGNASANTGGSEYARFFVYDTKTKRTGVHHVNLYYEKGNWQD